MKSPRFSAFTACQYSSWSKSRNVFSSPYATGGSGAHGRSPPSASATFHAHQHKKGKRLDGVRHSSNRFSDGPSATLRRLLQKRAKSRDEFSQPPEAGEQEPRVGVVKGMTRANPRYAPSHGDDGNSSRSISWLGGGLRTNYNETIRHWFSSVSGSRSWTTLTCFRFFRDASSGSESQEQLFIVRKTRSLSLCGMAKAARSVYPTRASVARFLLRLRDPVERFVRDAVLSEKEAQLSRMLLDVAQGVQLEFEKAHRLPPPPRESHLALRLLI